MKKLKQKNKRQLLRRSKKVISHKAKRQKKTRQYIPNPRFKAIKLRKNPEFHILEPPKILDLGIEHVRSVLKFINNIKKNAKNGYFIFLSLKNVEFISEGTISMLLSVISDLEYQGIFFRGDKPTNSDAKNTLERSGFFKHMNGNISKKNKISKNKILKTGTKDTHQKELVPEIHRAMETIWGAEFRCPSLYGGLGEMMRNTCDHAFQDKNTIMWHLGISHFESEKTVKFTFVDNGEGIVSTYMKKGVFQQLLKHFKNSAEMLEKAFKGETESRTGLPWRGKGLPTIFEMYSENIISNLVVITNNVFIDFNKQIVENINVGFSGTYYFWEINQKCAQAVFPINDLQNDFA
jgi:hypothetical protein